MFHPSLSRQCKMNDRNFHCCHLAYLVFSDLVFASTLYKRGNRCAQVYVTDFGWARAFPMASRSQAHETFSLLFARDSVPPACIWDNAKEIIQISSIRSSKRGWMSTCLLIVIMQEIRYLAEWLLDICEHCPCAVVL